MTISAKSGPSNALLGLLQLCAAGVPWGTGGLVVTVQHERDGLGAMTASAWRMLVAAVALVGFAAVTGHARRVLVAHHQVVDGLGAAVGQPPGRLG